MKRGLLISVCLLATAITGCAKSTKDIQAQYTSPMIYQGHSCQQIQQEMAAVSRRMGEVGGVVDKTASDDQAQMAVGLILLWPTLFFLDGDTPQAAEYARLKGDFQALEDAGIQKNCNIPVQPVTVTKTVTQTKTTLIKN